MAPSQIFDFINHEVSVSLDSTNAFEGPEKLLEIWFADSETCTDSVFSKGTLRDIPLPEIESMLDLVSCKIMSKISSKEMDAYLLSESSLFVFPHKMILKTCGTTATLLCLSKVLELVVEYCGYVYSNLENIHKIFYSRRSFMFPHKQNEIHRCWDNELGWLNKYFPPEQSKAYIVGDLSKDHWYLYLNGNGTVEQSPRVPKAGSQVGYPLSPVISNGACSANDETFEMLMTELDPTASEMFQLSKHLNEFPDMDPETEDYGHLLGQKMISKSGLDSVLDGYARIKHDAYAFTPCGFSSNSIMDDKFYCTLHITPETGWSYASFETNYPSASKTDVLCNVVNILKPGKFCVVHVQEAINEKNSAVDSLRNVCVAGYKRVDQILYDLKFDYSLLYMYFEKEL
ncbi:hypothetical protein OGAPHI_005657 [Ogataea philodendri]|uniref:S-adenosylmethionine decarboxylase proenzyme n=1 Tax=Ogataea philodendri TaxID=1378263 RepID=A0A9P8T1Y3_9ASCO|nr:uncharacterized protein OGAPHI_005657 [Ogataea philodendri]KAH3662405.1 hypothetical protein OGAPHI_005657 [Ogataea philodendri]